MIHYSQRDPLWANLKINGTNSTMRDYGCFITSLAMMAEISPKEALKKLEENGGLYKDLVISEKACQILGLDYIKTDAYLKSPQPMNLPCIAEVDFSPKEGKQTHFVVYLGEGKIIDSFDGKEKKNPYPITNYRNIFPKGTLKKEETKDRKIKELEELVELMITNSKKEEPEAKPFDFKKAGLYTTENFVMILAVLTSLQEFAGVEIDQALQKEFLAIGLSLLPQFAKFLKSLYAKLK